MRLTKISRSLISTFHSDGAVFPPRSLPCVTRFNLRTSPLSSALLRQASSTYRNYYTTNTSRGFEMADRSTLVRPPPLDPSKSSIENVLELTGLKAFGPVCLPIQMEQPKLPRNNPDSVCLIGRIYKYSPFMASSWSSRYLWRSSDCTMSVSRSTDCARELYCS